MRLTAEMDKAVNIIENTRQHLFVTGKAGAGKTTLLRHIIDNSDKEIIVTASTGVAAVNAGGCTLHSLLRIPFGILNPDEGIKKLDMRRNKIKVLNKASVLIIDEISMVRPDTMDYIDKALRLARRSNEPFGGMQIVMFGDLYQLPPVVKANEQKILELFYQGPYFYHSRALRAAGFHVVELNEVFRQTDETFVRILNRMRDYTITPDDLEDLASVRNMKASGDYDNYHIHLCSFRRDVDKINRCQLGEPTHTYEAELTGQFTENSAPCDMILELRVGARVMLLTNDSEGRYYNGSLGIVTGLSDDKVSVELDDGIRVTVEPYTWIACDYEVKGDKVETIEKGTCKQMPLTLAWAITIHKSQGLTFDKVALHTKFVFCPGQMYVALSRCRSLDGIVSDGFIGMKHIIKDRELPLFEKAYKQFGNFFNDNVFEMMWNENN
jgi:ATP-dependent exoDNAse (exonuclease V) alpha subunit